MKKLVFALSFFFALNSFSQKEANFWYFGENAGLDFSNGSPRVLGDSQLSTFEGCSSISDANGVLQFYSDGTTVWNKNHEIMKYSNGNFANDLKGDPSSSQSALVVPNPSNNGLYYIFTVGNDSFSTISSGGFNYYTVDMNKDNGKGEIIFGPVSLSQGNTTWSEKVTAVESDDCNAIWILSVNANNFIAYKIDSSGVNVTNPSLSSMNYSPRDLFGRGYLKVSPDGKKVAFADYSGSGSEATGGFDAGGGSLVLLDFDTSTGKISADNEKVLLDSNEDGVPYGVEFSQRSTKLYVSTHDGNNNKVFQFNITSSNTISSKALIHSQTGYRGALQLAPDNKIYATVPVSYLEGTRFLDVIENPDAEADEVRYTRDFIRLANGTSSTQGFPPFIQSFFSPVNIVNSDNPSFILNNTKQTVCIDDVVKMEPELSGNATSMYKWTKEGDTSVNINTRVLEINNTRFGSGIYYLEMTIEDACGREKKYNSSVEIEFIAKPIVNTITVVEQCDFDDIPNDYKTNFNLTLKESEIYKGTETVVINFFETDDVSLSNPINKSDYINKNPTRDSNHKLIAKIGFPKSLCFETVEIELKVNPSGLDSYPDVYTCETDVNSSNSNSMQSTGSDEGVFDFNQKTNQIIADSGGALSLNTHNFKYYRSEEDARLQINEIEKPYIDDLFTNGSDIYLKISLKGTDACQSVGQFKIFLQKLPIPKGNSTPFILCVTNPITQTQPLKTTLDGSTGISGDSYLWYRNNQRINGATNAKYEANQEGIYRVETYRNYTNNTPSTDDDITCMGYNTFTIVESNKAFIESIDYKDNQDNSNENTITITISGKGDYEFAINSSNIADFRKGSNNLSYTFTNVQPGLNTIYINDRNSCGITESQKVSFIFFQRFFTPNGDNNMDRWEINGIDNNFYKEVTVQIFDRYGTFIKSIDLKNRVGWNGFFNGKLLPKNDYWYNAVLIDVNNNVTTRKGHFSLIR